jgi:small-conductance mechanosensitive channel
LHKVVQWLSEDSLIERWFRLALLFAAMCFQAQLVDERYKWARPQNGGPLPTSRDLMFFAALPALVFAVGYLGKNLRVWSWAFVLFYIYESYWVIHQVFLDDGSAFTRIFYSNTLLRPAVLLPLFGLAAVASVVRRAWLRDLQPSRWKVGAAILLIPIWFVVTLNLY